MKIAISTRYEKNEEDNCEHIYINYEFYKIFLQMGITLIPILDFNDMEEICDLCDGLIVIGGNDVNPKLYGKVAHEKTKFCDNGYNDEIDYKLIEIFNKNKKPILGICRGMQVINTYFGRDLNQHIENHQYWGDFSKRHIIDIDPKSILYKLYGKKQIEVNSYHHQSVKNIAKGFKISAKSPDGIVEAMEKENVLTVQYHPEMLEDSEFLENYIKYTYK